MNDFSKGWLQAHTQKYKKEKRAEKGAFLLFKSVDFVKQLLGLASHQLLLQSQQYLLL